MPWGSDRTTETGLSGHAGAEGRADECPRCGFKSTRDTWVLDPNLKRFVCTLNNCQDRDHWEFVAAAREQPGVNEDG